MTSSNQKICKVPKCDKEVYDTGLLFCGEHQRDWEAVKKVTRKGSATLLTAGVVFIAKRGFNHLK